MTIRFLYQLSPLDSLWVTLVPAETPDVKEDRRFESRLKFYRHKDIFFGSVRAVFGAAERYTEFVSDIDLASVSPHGSFISGPQELTEDQIDKLGFLPFRIEFV